MPDPDETPVPGPPDARDPAEPVEEARDESTAETTPPPE